MKKIIVVFVAFLSLNAFSQSITSGITGMWNFNGVATDGSGFSNNGTVNGAALTTDRFGNGNNSYDFSGNQSIALPNSVVLSTNFSISVYTTLQNITPQFCAILGRWQGASNKFSFELSKRNTNKIGFVYSTNGTNAFEVASTTVFGVSNNWIHIAVTYDGATIKLYINGVLENSIANSTPIYNNGDVTYIGATRSATPNASNSFFWTGKIDDVTIWNRAITAQEVTSIYNGTAALPVELTQFSASCSENTTTINWQTASENNSAYFEVLQSRDGETWTSKTTTLAAGNSTSTIDYSFTDNNEASLVYYKLKQVDKDGQYKEYGPISADCNENNQLTIYPNPTIGDFTIKGLELYDTISFITIQDINGTTVKELDPKAANFNLETINSGVYFLTICADNKKEVKKIIFE